MKAVRDTRQVLGSLLIVGLAAASLDAQPAETPAVTSWSRNTTGAKGSSPDSTIDAIVSQFDADVQRVRHNGTDVYINAMGIPSYSIGPWPDGNPAVAVDRNLLLRIPKVPQEQTSTKTPTRPGSIGNWGNGVAMYNAWDAQCFDTACNWKQDATVFELDG